jgi:hypothetical protein
LKLLLIYTSVPLLCWAVAFLIWFYWYDLTGSGAQRADRTRPVVKAKPSDSTPAKAPRERILDEERKKLEDFVKRRG